MPPGSPRGRTNPKKRGEGGRFQRQNMREHSIMSVEGASLRTHVSCRKTGVLARCAAGLMAKLLPRTLHFTAIICSSVVGCSISHPATRVPPCSA
jgi:hypothetical protein